MKKKILILGGSHFIGRNLIEALISINKYELFLFNRGLTNPGLFTDIQKIKGDRDDETQNAIRSGSWDIIVDLSCYYPDQLRKTLQNISFSPEKYIFLSTCSVYDNEGVSQSLRNENSKILSCNEEQYFSDDLNTYGARKAECERLLTRSKFNCTILRPALVYGKYDGTDRFYYWPYQVRTKSRILVPEAGKRQFSVSYVHDLVKIIIASIENKIANDVYNAISQPQTSIAKIIDASISKMKRNPDLINLSSRFLKSQKVNEWWDFPLWLNSDIFTFSHSKLLGQLDFPLASFTKSLDDSFKYYEELSWPKPKSGKPDEWYQKLDSLL
tara:strand:- start:2108 stop:3091 length:984 start_codon:yes stop_codon:yes gene_type:complete